MCEHIEQENLIEQVDAVLSEQNALMQHATSPLVRAILGTVPFTGGIANLLGDVVQKRQEIRLRRFLIKFGESVETAHQELRSKLDREFVRTDEFAATIESILQEAARTADERKLEFLRQFLLSSSMTERPDVTWRDLFLHYLRQLSGVHLVILTVFRRVQGDLPKSDRLGGSEIPGKVPVSLDQLRQHGAELDDRLANIACIDLANLGLIVDWRSIRRGHLGLHEKYCLSDSGLLFTEFLEGQWHQTKPA